MKLKQEVERKKALLAQSRMQVKMEERDLEYIQRSFKEELDRSTSSGFSLDRTANSVFSARAASEPFFDSAMDLDLGKEVVEQSENPITPPSWGDLFEETDRFEDAEEVDDKLEMPQYLSLLSTDEVSDRDVQEERSDEDQEEERSEGEHSDDVSVESSSDLEIVPDTDYSRRPVPVPPFSPTSTSTPRVTQVKTVKTVPIRETLERIRRDKALQSQQSEKIIYITPYSGPDSDDVLDSLSEDCTHSESGSEPESEPVSGLEDELNEVLEEIDNLSVASEVSESDKKTRGARKSFFLRYPNFVWSETESETEVEVLESDVETVHSETRLESEEQSTTRRESSETPSDVTIVRHTASTGDIRVTGDSDGETRATPESETRATSESENESTPPLSDLNKSFNEALSEVTPLPKTRRKPYPPTQYKPLLKAVYQTQWWFIYPPSPSIESPKIISSLVDICTRIAGKHSERLPPQMIAQSHRGWDFWGKIWTAILEYNKDTFAVFVCFAAAFGRREKFSCHTENEETRPKHIITSHHRLQLIATAPTNQDIVYLQSVLSPSQTNMNFRNHLIFSYPGSSLAPNVLPALPTLKTLAVLDLRGTALSSGALIPFLNMLKRGEWPHLRVIMVGNADGAKIKEFLNFPQLWYVGYLPLKTAPLFRAPDKWYQCTTTDIKENKRRRGYEKSAIFGSVLKNAKSTRPTSRLYARLKQYHGVPKVYGHVVIETCFGVDLEVGVKAGRRLSEDYVHLVRLGR
ncbi:hypothetical protein CJU90_3024 [Yarrowia sp. C11]|nr:hypothetical protein CKK34_4474 [Yarrowia sp. E02]KAG5369561.1 hypothetical protein CJU90_3024 [Yarrowia sp. C11]